MSFNWPRRLICRQPPSVVLLRSRVWRPWRGFSPAASDWCKEPQDQSQYDWFHHALPPLSPKMTREWVIIIVFRKWKSWSSLNTLVTLLRKCWRQWHLNSSWPLVDHKSNVNVSHIFHLMWSRRHTRANTGERLRKTNGLRAQPEERRKPFPFHYIYQRKDEHIKES